MSFFSIWIDADSCPSPVKDLVIRFCKRLNLNCFFVANRALSIPKASNFKMIVTEATKDAADNYIVENCSNDDIVITRDILLAERLLNKNITTINDRGLTFSQENIKEKLSMRNFNLELFECGLVGDKTSSFGKKEINDFANCFDREIQKKLKKYN